MLVDGLLYSRMKRCRHDVQGIKAPVFHTTILMVGYFGHTPIVRMTDVMTRKQFKFCCK